jgi:hypothetical protein
MSMHCPICGGNSTGDNGRCPHCGNRIEEKPAGILKTSTILISADDTNGVYRSVGEVPEPLRQRLLRSTNGILSRTILIADRRGRVEIERALRNLRGEWRRRSPNSPMSRSLPSTRWKLTLAQGLGLLLAGATGLLAWLMLSHY